MQINSPVSLAVLTYEQIAFDRVRAEVLIFEVPSVSPGNSMASVALENECVKSPQMRDTFSLFGYAVGLGVISILIDMLGIGDAMVVFGVAVTLL